MMDIFKYEEVLHKVKNNLYDETSTGLYEDLCDIHGLNALHPTVANMYSYSWQLGHEGGREEVVHMFMDLVEMNKDIEEIFT